ncbi:unnamed protein product [Bursaphelenchus xylophilus]|uniref:(pine wood nematode) hypothetical protein n=1 Tax=Bursaphelenchus xylophilus TaxID=6326 RepID=A0A1I7RXA4_BURXY|nr:unnamed protein product [Bursaphelenchus xylophilus]CAG9121483.1 unnamed protein product [Bursaphelenchus xylophilus]
MRNSTKRGMFKWMVEPELEEQLARMEEEDRESDADDGREHRNIIEDQRIRLAEYQLRIEEREREIVEYLEVIRELEGTVGSLQARMEDLEERLQVMAHAPMLMTGLPVFTKSTMDIMTEPVFSGRRLDVARMRQVYAVFPNAPFHRLIGTETRGIRRPVDGAPVEYIVGYTNGIFSLAATREERYGSVPEFVQLGTKESNAHISLPVGSVVEVSDFCNVINAESNASVLRGLTGCKVPGMAGLPHPSGIATRFRVTFRPWTRDERAVVSRVIFTRDYRDREVPSDAHFRAVLALQRNLEERLSMGFDQFVRTSPRPSENDVVIVRTAVAYPEMRAKCYRWDEEAPMLLLPIYMVQKYSSVGRFEEVGDGCPYLAGPSAEHLNLL